jgi:hypothetical protein
VAGGPLTDLHQLLTQAASLVTGVERRSGFR